MFRAVLRSGRGFASRTASGKTAVRTLVNAKNSLNLLKTHRNKLLNNVTSGSTSFIRNYSSDLPEHIKVVLPALSPTMEEGTLISWAKKEGDQLNEGDLLAEIETDKATMAFETPEEGYLAKILVPAGTKAVPIGKLVCIIVPDEGSVAAFKDFVDDGSSVSQKKATPPTPPSPPVAASAPPTPIPTPIPTPTPVAPPAQQEVSSSRMYVSPMARRLAEQRNIRLQGKGSGLYDSITSADLEKMAAASGGAGAMPSGAPIPAMTPVPAGATYVDIPVTNIRGVIAKRLLESKLTIPHYYVTIDLNAEKIVNLRTRMNKKLEKSGVKLSLNDFIIKALALASVKVPEANSSWQNTFIRQYKNVDVSVAVSTDRGLITPIVFEANNKGVVAISKEMKSLAQKARDGRLQPNEFQGGTIGLSNLGMFDVDHFSAIINPPQSCILAVGRVSSKLVKDDTAEQGFKEIPVMSVTLSSDHRTVDGAVAARWMQAFREYLEDPETMIL